MKNSDFVPCLKVRRDHSNSKISDPGFTGYYDDNNQPIFVGNKLKSEWGYEVIVVKDGDDYVGKLVCDPKHSCANMSYSLNNGYGHTKIFK